MVGFGDKSRFLGDDAKKRAVKEFKNTVGALNRLAGRSWNDPDTAIEQEYITAPLVDIGGKVGVEVSYLGKKERFTAVQLLAMFLGTIKRTAQYATESQISDVAISCPAWFTDIQRRAVLDASQVAGLKVLRLINDNTAIALGYGITKSSDFPEKEKPKPKGRRVAFVDIGYSDYTCSIVEFWKGELEVKATSCDRHFGGRNFDKALVDHFAVEFKKKPGIDVKSDPKATARLTAEAEKLKKVLSTIKEAALSVECLMDDKDVYSKLKRDELDELIKPLLDRATRPLEQALEDAHLSAEDIDVVEIIGGCTRVPALQERISKFFGKKLSVTMNQNEAIAMGCGYACALLSPAYLVRDFTVLDIVSYPIEFTWEESPEIPDQGNKLTVFTKGKVMPSTMIMTIYRSKPFDIEARYTNPETLPGMSSPVIGRFSINDVKVEPGQDFMTCKIKARLNEHGILEISAYYEEFEEVEERERTPEEKETEKKKDGEPAETEGNGSAEPKPKPREPKKKAIKRHLTVSAGIPSLDQATKQSLVEKESTMLLEDEMLGDMGNKINALDELIIKVKGYLNGIYATLAEPDEQAEIKAKVDQSEVRKDHPVAPLNPD